MKIQTKTNKQECYTMETEQKKSIQKPTQTQIVLSCAYNAEKKTPNEFLWALYILQSRMND